MSVKNNIPEHWQVKKLGEILKVSSGKGIKVNLLKGGDFPVYGGNGINGYHSEYFIEHPKLIIGRVGAKCGVTYITRPKSWVTDNALIVDPIISEFDIKFFQLKLEYENLNKLSVSTAQPVISGSKIYDYEILLPPLPEQLAIVSKIEELLSDLENGKQQLLTAQQQLKVYRQSLLKAAFEGKLSLNCDSFDLCDKDDLKKEALNHNNQNNHTNQSSDNLPKGWKWVKLGDICLNVEYGSSTKSKKEGKTPVLRMGNIQKGIFDWTDLVYSDDDIEINKYLLKKNDVLFNRTNSAELVGKTAIYKGERQAIFAGYLIRINRIESIIDANYLTYYLNTIAAKQYGNTIRSFGVNQSNINGTKLKTYPIPLPSLSEQQQIVEILESKLTVCDKIEETIKEALLKSESLRQSILKKAFSGQLI
jgi:type I restriction enzyme S subunit